MDDYVISIIVPVYNVENYLTKCLDSLIHQKSNNYEIILVNDGSTDDSHKLCLNYQKKFPEKVKYFLKENSGLSETRNFGIKKASGKYIMFVDSDDYLDSNSIDKLIKLIKLNSPDILYFGYYYETEDVMEKRFTYFSEKDKLYDLDEYMMSELKQRNLSIPACFAVYKKDLIIENDLYFASGILHEDERWSPQILLKSKKIYLSSINIYHYIQRAGSITHKKDKTKNGLHLIETAEILLDKSNSIKNKKIKKMFKNKCAMLYMRGLTIGNLYRKEYKQNINRKIPLLNTFFLKDKIKSLIFCFNLKLYVTINKKVKGE